MKKILVTILVTFLVTVLTVLGLLVGNGNITVTEKGEDHIKQIYVDGVLTEEKNWTDILGYELEIHFNDSAYVGK